MKCFILEHGYTENYLEFSSKLGRFYAGLKKSGENIGDENYLIREMATDKPVLLKEMSKLITFFNILNEAISRCSSDKIMVNGEFRNKESASINN